MNKKSNRKRVGRTWHTVISPIVLVFGIGLVGSLYMVKENRSFNDFISYLIEQSAVTVELLVGDGPEVPSSVVENLDKSFFGSPIYAIVFDGHGDIVAGNLKGERSGIKTAGEFVHSFDFSNEVGCDVENAMQFGTFDLVPFRATEGVERFYVRKLGESGLTMAIVMPSSSYVAIFEHRISNTGSVILGVIVLLITYIIFMVIKFSRKNNRILEESEQALRENADIFADAGYGTWRVIKDQQGNLNLYCNEPLLKIIGAEGKNLSPRELFDFYQDRILVNLSDLKVGDDGHPVSQAVGSRIITWNHEQKGSITLSVGGTKKVNPDGTKVYYGYCGDISGQTKITDALTRIYFASYYVDLNLHKYMEVSTPDDIREFIPREGVAQEAFDIFLKSGVQDACLEDMKKFTDLGTLQDRLRYNQSISMDYESLERGWCRASFVVVSRCGDEGVGSGLGTGDVESCLFVIENVDALIRKGIEHQKKLHELNATLESYNQALNEAKDEAEAANNAKTTFLFNMSHDIRTPMNAILGFTQLLELKQNDPELVKEYVNKIHSAGEYLLTIINNVLDMAKIESGNAVLDIGVVDTAATDDTTLAVFEKLLTEKNLKLSVERDVKHRFLALDNTKIKQILINLMSNAVKYTPNEGTIFLSIKELPCEREGYAKIQTVIRDSGIGMSQEFLERIFEPFSREKNSTDSKIIGTGLGMAIVKKLVDLMGGTIEVESELGKGSCFTVTMDHLIAEDPELYMAKGMTVQVEPGRFEGKRILLAEDNELNAQIATAILEDKGFEVEVARDGVECLDMFLDEDAGYYSLILMDIQMPNLNGYDTAEKIRNFSDPEKSNIPIIAMTANAFEEDKKKAYEYGMNAHVAKPIDVQQLMATIREIIK